MGTLLLARIASLAKRVARCVVATCLAVGPLCASGATRTLAARVLVISSDDARPYREAIQGLREAFAGDPAGRELRVERASADPRQARAALGEWLREGPSAVVTLGAVATRLVTAELAAPPLVACLVLSPELVRDRPNATAVTLEFPIEQQLDWVRRMLPDRTIVGVLFNPKENGERVASARTAAAKLGLELVTREVPTPEELPVALKNFDQRAQLLLGIPDGVVLSPEAAKTLLLFSLQSRIPLVGPSESWVKAGALYALERDYVDLGRQCGEQALAAGSFAASRAPAPSTPRKVLQSINLQTMRSMKIEIPAALVEAAASRYE